MKESEKKYLIAVRSFLSQSALINSNIVYDEISQRVAIPQEEWEKLMVYIRTLQRIKTDWQNPSTPTGAEDIDIHEEIQSAYAPLIMADSSQTKIKVENNIVLLDSQIWEGSILKVFELSFLFIPEEELSIGKDLVSALKYYKDEMEESGFVMPSTLLGYNFTPKELENLKQQFETAIVEQDYFDETTEETYTTEKEDLLIPYTPISIFTWSALYEEMLDILHHVIPSEGDRSINREGITEFITDHFNEKTVSSQEIIDALITEYGKSTEWNREVLQSLSNLVNTGEAVWSTLDTLLIVTLRKDEETLGQLRTRHNKKMHQYQERLSLSSEIIRKTTLRPEVISLRNTWKNNSVKVKKSSDNKKFINRDLKVALRESLSDYVLGVEESKKNVISQMTSKPLETKIKKTVKNSKMKKQNPKKGN